MEEVALGWMSAQVGAGRLGEISKRSWLRGRNVQDEAGDAWVASLGEWKKREMGRLRQGGGLQCQILCLL